MMIFLVFMEFIAFPERKDALLLSSPDNVNNIISTVSGSLGLYYGGECHQTFPNETYHVEKKYDWCSAISKSKEDKQWISYSLKNKVMKVKGFSIRNGCCWYECCCMEDGKSYDYACCCMLYSFSLQGSNDNRTWKIIHKVEKEEKFYSCLFKTYEFPETESFRFIRLVQDEEYPGCPACMQINQVELYGTALPALGFEDADDQDGDESVSIIGKIKRNNID